MQWEELTEELPWCNNLDIEAFEKLFWTHGSFIDSVCDSVGIDP